MNEEIFKQWWDDPATEYFIKYLRDSSKQEAVDLLATILSGTVVAAEEQLTVVTTIRILERIAQIDFQEIRGFYQ